MSTDEADEAEFFAWFRVQRRLKQPNSVGRPRAPHERDFAIFAAVITAHKRGHPLSPPAEVARKARRPSDRRAPGAATGKESAFSVVSGQFMRMGGPRGVRSGWKVSPAAIRAVYESVRKTLDALSAIDRDEFVFHEPLWVKNKATRMRWLKRLSTRRA